METEIEKFVVMFYLHHPALHDVIIFHPFKRIVANDGALSDSGCWLTNKKSKKKGKINKFKWISDY